MSRPYYEDEYVRLFRGDAREILPSLAFDAVITDPPYGLRPINGTGYGRERLRIAGDETTDLSEWLLSAWGGPAILFGLWQRPPTTRAPVRQLVWSKTQMGLTGSSLPWRNSHEVAWVFGEGWDAPDRGTVWTTAREFAAVHPTQKPLELMQWLVEASRPEWTVCDPFMGSGTTVVAAKNLGRRAIGIELEEKYCEVAALRLSQGVLPLEAS